MTPLSPEKHHQDQPQYHGKDSIGIGQVLSRKASEPTVVPSAPECVRETQASQEAVLESRRKPPLLPTGGKREKPSDPSRSHRSDDQAAPKLKKPSTSLSRASGSLMEDCVVGGGARRDDAAAPVTEVSELAKLMLGPGGLPLKKVTPEGFAIPIALRLLEPSSPALLSLTWLDGDEHGFDLGRLTAIKVLGSSEHKSLMWNDVYRARLLRPSTQAGNCGASDVHQSLNSGGRRKGVTSRSWRGCVRFGCSSQLLLLRWKSLDAEVVLEVVSQQQSDLLRRCLEQLVSEAQSVEKRQKALSLNEATGGWGTRGVGDEDKVKEEGQARNSVDWDSDTMKQPEKLSWGGTGSLREVDGVRETGWAGGRARSEAEIASRGIPDLEQHKKTVAELAGRLLAAYDKAEDGSREAAWRVGATILKRVLCEAASRQTATCWGRWCAAVRKANEDRQHADRLRWFLHARANRDNDLLAWYHSTFCREVYRRRVPFWYRETRLQLYQETYRVVDDGPDSYTPMEKSIMTSCVCTVGTKYPDVAAQIFTAREVLTAEEYRLFQTLVKLGTEVSKAAPKSGKRAPYPMKLRLWFDRGALCLTSKRQKPNRAYTTDYSFYLSKVKICLLIPGRAAVKEAAEATIAAAGAGAPGVAGQGRDTREVEDHASPSGSPRGNGPLTGVGSSSSSRTRRTGRAWAWAWAGAKALAGVAEGNDDEEGSGGGLGESRGPADGSWSNVLLNPRYFYRRNDETGLAGAQYVPGIRDSISSSGSGSLVPGSLQGVCGDEADRGAGDGHGDGAAWEEVSDTSSEFAVVPSSGRVSIAPRRVLSIKFFGRLAPLELWFAEESEGQLWQGMLTKLAWKEQGYLYSEPSSGEAAGPGQAHDEHHNEQSRAARYSFFSSSSEGGGGSVSSASIASTPCGDGARHRHLADEGSERRDEFPVPSPVPVSADASRGVRWQMDEKPIRGDVRARDMVLSPASVSTGLCSPTESIFGRATAKLVESTTPR